MANTFATTGGDSHSQSKTGLNCDSTYVFYVRCADDADTPNKSSSSSVITFTTASTTDTAVPTLSTAVLAADGRTLTLTFNESVKFGAGGNGGVTITPTGGAATVSYVSGEYSTALVYYTSRIIYPTATETLTTTYTQPGNGIEDIAGNDKATFSNQATTNNSNQSTVTVTADGQPIWPADVTVGAEVQGEGYTGEFGVKFGSTVSGVVTAIRFYKGENNTGTHSGSIWYQGALLGTVTFADETASGWQQQALTTPVHINSDMVSNTLVASYFNSSGYWNRTVGYFGAENFSSSPLYTLANTEANGYNGTTAQSATSIYPNEGSISGRNFWADVRFRLSRIKTTGAGGSVTGAGMQLQ
jgi:hypothetical protein